MNIFKKRLRDVRTIMNEQRLDGIVLYGNGQDAKYIKWICGQNVPMFNYFFVSNSKSGLLELSYLIESRSSIYTGEIIAIQDEDTVQSDFAKLIGKKQKIGFVGSVPFKDLPKDKTYIDMTRCIDSLLMIKSRDEIAKISAAAKVLDDAFAYMGSLNLIGMTEKTLGERIRMVLLEKSDRLAFPVSIVSSDVLKNTTVTLSPTDRKLQKNDVVCIDIGVVKNGFYADATQMFFTGESIIKDAYQKLLKEHKNVMSKLRAGITLNEIRSWYEIVCNKFEKDPLFRGNNVNLEFSDLGHGIGFGLHEEPFIFREETKNMKLKKNMVIALEPEVVFDSFRIRVENMILIQSDKCKTIV